MLNETVYEWLDKKGYADRITEHTETIDTVEHAAQQIGCSEAEIAKTLSFIVDEKPVIVVMAGDGRVNSSKFKAQFHTKPSMVPRDQVEELIGFAPGGVCPFGVREDIPVWVKPKRHALTVPQQRVLTEFVTDNREFCGWYPVFIVLLGTGMRIGECLGIRWDDLDFVRSGTES